MNHPKQIVSLAGVATQMEERPADAAALLVDAAAMLSVEAKMPLHELANRLAETREIFTQSMEAHGLAAGRKQ